MRRCQIRVGAPATVPLRVPAKLIMAVSSALVGVQQNGRRYFEQARAESERPLSGGCRVPIFQYQIGIQGYDAKAFQAPRYHQSLSPSSGPTELTLAGTGDV